MVHGFLEAVLAIESQAQGPRQGTARDSTKRVPANLGLDLDSPAVADCIAGEAPGGPVDLRLQEELELIRIHVLPTIFALGDFLEEDVDGRWRAVVACHYS